MFFRNLRRFAIIGLLFHPNLVLAWPHGSAAFAPSPGVQGVVGFDFTNFAFVNFMKMAIIQPPATSSFVWPNFIAANTQLPTGTLPGNLGYGVYIPQTYFGQYVTAVQGTVSGGSGLQWGLAGSFGQVYAISAGTTLSGCSNGNVPPCYYQNTLSITGTNPVVTHDFSAPITGAVNNGGGLVRLSIANTNLANAEAVTIVGVVGSDGHGCGANGEFTLSNRTATTVDLVGSTFPGGCTYSSGGQLFAYQSTTQYQPVLFATTSATFSLTSLIMCKLADYNADNTCNTTAGKTSWPGGFNDDFLADLATLGVPYTRMLDANKAVFDVPMTYSSWPTTSAFSYFLDNAWVDVPNWFGSDSGTNSYSITCSGNCTYLLTGGAPQDGDSVEFNNLNANTSQVATLTVTDKNSVTSSAIPILGQGGNQASIVIGGTITAGDTVALKFTTTPLGAYTCLSGGQHTTSAYTVIGGDTVGNIQQQLVSIMNADSTLLAQPSVIAANNPFGGSGEFFVNYASNACALTITGVITGSATETVSVGTLLVGDMTANTIYSANYDSLLKAWVVNTIHPGAHRQSWPWIIQIDLAKALSLKTHIAIGCWLQPNLFWSSASFTSFANLAAANQCPGGTYMELGNEIWNTGNPITGHAAYRAASLGMTYDAVGYLMLRNRQFWAIASSSFGGLTGNLHTTANFQLSGATTSELSGSTLCGTSCSNQAYQNAIGTNYNTAPNRPADFTRHIGQAPYYNGAMISTSYGVLTYSTWSSTSASIASNVLTIGGTITGTLFWNQGVSSCDGVTITPPTPSDPTSSQLTGKVTTTLNGATNDFQTTWTLTSTAGLQTGMWVYNSANGTMSGTIASINSGANQITITSSPANEIYRSVGSNDTIVFGGKAGTYQLNSTSCAASTGTITGGDILGLQYAADNYNGLNSAKGSQQDALNWVYQDALNGTFGGFMLVAQTIKGMTSVFNSINNVANTYGMTVADYEGGFQAKAPTTTQATNIGLPSSAYGGAGGYVDLLLTAFKNNVLFKNLEITRKTNELALLPANSKIMWFTYEGGNGQWSIFPNTLYAPTPYQSYKAICDNNGGSC